jgi:hypothetical protein
MNMRKVFTLALDRITPHNTALLKPVGSEVRIISMHTIDGDGRTIDLLSSPINIESPTSVRYGTIISSTLWVEIESAYINELSIDDVLDVHVSMAEYSTAGAVTFPEAKMVFHEYLSLSYLIENVKDVYAQAILGIRTLDKYENIIYSEDIALGLNDDGKMVAHATTGHSVTLPYIPMDGSVEVIAEGDRTKEFTVSGNTVSIDVPDGSDCYIVYKPDYISDGVFSEVSGNVSINSSNEIKLRDDQCDTIIYTLSIKIFNTDLTSTNHTPIIKSLAVVSSNK